MPPKYKFSEGEKVLCFHGPLLYESKVLKIQVKDKAVQFLIHYSGWNKTWDEWVSESRALKWNDTNLQKQKDLQAQYPDSSSSKHKRPKKRERPKKEAEGSSTSRRKRARQDQPESSTREPSPEREVKISIPAELRKWLVDDWDFITRQKQLVRVPKKVTVKDILQKYKGSVSTSEPEKAKSGQIQEVCDGIREYFNAMLGSQLLYKFERPQYAEILKAHPNTPMAEIYGIEHLLRLFVRIGSMLGYTPMDEDSLSLLLSHIQDFLKFLEDSQELFTMEYDAAPQEYHRRMT